MFDYEKLVAVGYCKSKEQGSWKYNYAIIILDYNYSFVRIYNIRGGTLDYIKRYGVTKCCKYNSYESYKDDMIDTYKNIDFMFFTLNKIMKNIERNKKECYLCL